MRSRALRSVLHDRQVVAYERWLEDGPGTTPAELRLEEALAVLDHVAGAFGLELLDQHQARELAARKIGRL